MTTAYLSAALLAAFLAPPSYRTYHNDRFGYRVDYPADFKPQPEAANGDGRRFVSPDGQTVLTAYASYQVLDGGLATYRSISREHWQKQHATIVLDQKTSTGFVLSGTVKDLVVGSGFEFTDRGTHSLKGAPGEWPLYTVGQ